MEDVPPGNEIDQSKVHQVQENFLDDDEDGEFDFLANLQNKQEPRSSTHIIRSEFGKHF